MLKRTLASAAAAVAMLAGQAGIAAADGTIFCLRDGLQIKADRFESRDGKFYLFVGSSSPIEQAAANIAGINVPCPQPAALVKPAPAAAAVPATAAGGGFGIHGSNTIGERLMPMLIEAFAEKRVGGKSVVKVGAPEEQEITLATAGKLTVVQLHAHGSGTSAKGLASGAAIIGMSSRRANEAEIKSVEDALKVNLLAPGNEHVVALDGLAVIVNPANPVRQLTLDQIAQIFTGTITNWSQVGGSDAAISVHRRDDKSGTFDTFNALVLAPRKLKVSAQAKAYESSETLSDDVFRNPNAIGFIGLPYINRNRALQIASACGLAAAPAKFTIKTETYPLARRLFLYTAGEPRQTTARDFLRFALSDDAQPTVQEAGFVDQSVDLQQDADQKGWIEGILASPTGFLPDGKAIPAIARSVLERSLAQSRRTSLVLRFERASTVLDTRARQDVERFARYLGSPALKGKRFVIAGFADSDGGFDTNARLSRERALSVAAALRQAGVAVTEQQILAHSYQAPVACNDSDAGKANNRRVEIWLSR